jgi:CheY-like chemotaxis protein
MALAQAIAEHLPFLRRYSRALCGSQKSGDAYVRATLQAIVADPAIVPSTLPTRVGLYRVFHVIWSSTDVETSTQPATDLAVERKLQHLTPASRQALLLTAMEGFTRGETARILGISDDKALELLASALQEIARQPPTKVLIIEDEPIISLDLQSIMRELGHTIAGVSTTRDEAVQAARRTQPGLVLADIKLADGSSGIDAVKQILHDIAVPVVFITAYPERLLTGERPEPTFLVTKPFVPETVRAAVSQALLFT